jgi:iron-sulfur cluster assembly accessory protein
MAETQMKQLVTKDMIIGDVLEKYPDVAGIMLEHGLHCVGCHANVFDTIEAGMKVHGIPDEEIEVMVKEINEFLAEQKPKVPVHDLKDAKVFLTDVAATKVKELLQKKNKADYGLRVRVLPGGCSGFVYQMAFEKESAADDVVVSDKGVKLLVDAESMGMLNGATIDYVDDLNQSGFKIENPNATQNCGCGKSFG